MQFPDNFSPSQIELGDLPTPDALPYSGPPTLIENPKKRPLGAATFTPKSSPKKRARVTQRPPNALDLSMQNPTTDLNLIDLINLANTTAPEVGQGQNGTDQNGTDAQLGLYQLLALQYLAELNKNEPTSRNVGSDQLGSDGEIGSVSSGSPEVKIRSRSISPFQSNQSEPQDEPLDLSQPKRMKLAISEN